MNDRSENILSMAQAVNSYLGSTPATLLTVNPTVANRKNALVADLAAVATLLGNTSLLTSEGLGATAGKKLNRGEFNRLILKVSSGLVSAFNATGDIENATAVRYTKSKITHARDQDLPSLVTVLTTKAALVSGILTAHNISSTELTLLTTTAATWGTTASKGTGKKSGSTASRQAAAAKIDAILLFLKDQLDPLITTFALSTVEAERTAAAGYFAARTIIDLHGPGTPPPPPPPPPTP